MIVAQQFTAGIKGEMKTQSVKRTAGAEALKATLFSRPPDGLLRETNRIPAINRWPIVSCPLRGLNQALLLQYSYSFNYFTGDGEGDACVAIAGDAPVVAAAVFMLLISALIKAATVLVNASI